MNDQIAIVLKSYPLFEKDMVVELYKRNGAIERIVKYANQTSHVLAGYCSR